MAKKLATRFKHVKFGMKINHEHIRNSFVNQQLQAWGWC
jgi:hypothetical protein